MPGCFNGFSVLVSTSPTPVFFTTVVVEVKWSEMEKNNVLVWTVQNKHRFVFSSYYHTDLMQDSSDGIMSKGLFVCQIICDVCDMCVTSQCE